MRVEIAELRRAATRLFDHVEKSGRRTIDLEHDHYWEVPRESRYNVYEEPKQLHVGQLAEDVECLRTLSDPREPVVAYGFVWLSSVLREIGEQEIG